jgi:replicative superfamily II helicase
MWPNRRGRVSAVLAAGENLRFASDEKQNHDDHFGRRSRELLPVSIPRFPANGARWSDNFSQLPGDNARVCFQLLQGRGAHPITERPKTGRILVIKFEKRIRKGAVAAAPIDPVALYETLDRASDKGPLRPAQEAILREWHHSRRAEQDLILKLHTGQGKTVIGLLMLQSLMNEGHGPALYLCPNHYLADQTCTQATQFGIAHMKLDGEIPSEFQESRKILVAVIQSFFNGYTKFGLGGRSVPIGSLVMDDAHACIDSIRNSAIVHLDHTHAAYRELRELFSNDLKGQGAGTYEDLLKNSYSAVLPVPYWAWRDKQSEVVTILSKYSDKTNSIKFAWPLVRDSLAECSCVFSGLTAEIVPHLSPIHEFGSYVRAKRRIFMSATVANDAFLVKGLGLKSAVITKPLVYAKETWSGEKMILIPQLLDPTLDRSGIVHEFAPQKPRKFGVVVLTPSFARFADWEKLGAQVARKSDDVTALLGDLIAGKRDNTVVFASRYDGIDLPDAVCRILILDSRPHSEQPTDMYMERCLEYADWNGAAIAKKIEQGLGRAVRGEKDYCVILLIGPDLVSAVRTKEARRFLSTQTQKQIEIGLEVVEFAKEDADKDASPKKILIDVLNQCLQRDDGWKEYYVGKMDGMTQGPAVNSTLSVFEREREAEEAAQSGNLEMAMRLLQRLADEAASPLLKGWYLQEMARIEYVRSKTASNKLQLAAHKSNRRLLKPAVGTTFTQVALIGQRRIANILEWIKRRESFESVMVSVEELLSSLHFGVDADRFENALDSLGRALGFATERPDWEWKEGPDNLWAMKDGVYALFECKSEVDPKRSDIVKAETDQINRSADWFQKNYPTASVSRFLIIPTKRVGRAAALTYDTLVMRERSLERLRNNVRNFFKEFAAVDLRDVADSRIQGLLTTHHLTVDEIPSLYGEKPSNAAREEGATE